ncbi:MAG: ATP-sensitive inward rectifier potassium channel 10, partial [Moorea sp. SIO2C4]|nr:ATP-sensitive inward rectifier potassium channel 10 [Moorena sp. SIO2C4]
NERDNRILEAQLRVSLLRYEVTLEGESMRRFYDMKLLRSQTPSFGLTWTVMHPIDQSSPLYGETPESLAEMEATLIITLVGIDETVSQTIHARHSYTASEILWDRRFVDMFHRKSDGSRIIDYSHFHDIK